jgi:aspartyl-tRNA(Asn)/glutamyl-tRNA(Gln) amidotransferase subunit B
VSRSLEDIRSVRLIVGLEIHVELATRSKMFSRAPNPACTEHENAEPNTLTDATVLALPGSLPVMNLGAVEMAMRVGLALGCRVAGMSKWDRKNYFYPDMPKAYQISQYDLPLCFDGAVDVPAVDEQGLPDPEGPAARIGIIRAHLEEDAGKLLHESPGGLPIDHSIVDLNRAGAPLLEIVTQPDFTTADQVVAFARQLRQTCRALGVTLGVMQKGHMRFEPNINVALTLSDGREVRTPVVEVKNLNSFRSLRGAIEHELKEQPGRWVSDGLEMGPGRKTTRRWDDERQATYVQRHKEDADDYRYFPDPDLPLVAPDEAWVERLRDALPELPSAKYARFIREFGLSRKEAATLVEEPELTRLYESSIGAMAGMEYARAGRVAANLLLQAGLKRANERQMSITELAIDATAVGAIGMLRESGRVSAAAADELFGAFCDGGPGRSVEEEAGSRGLLIVRDDAALERWCDEVIAGNARAAEDVRTGKVQAVGRLVGEVMKKAGGAADAKTVRETLLRKLGQG